MAYIEKRIHNGKTTYRARVRVHGMPDQSASFSTRTAALSAHPTSSLLRRFQTRRHHHRLARSSPQNQHKQPLS